MLHFLGGSGEGYCGGDTLHHSQVAHWSISPINIKGSLTRDFQLQVFSSLPKKTTTVKDNQQTRARHHIACFFQEQTLQQNCTYKITSLVEDC